ncbi:MAG: ADP-ribosylglycohydrolase family protein [Oscillospiraceae bacterium]|nr:ADP-ribosylglycohydrolase family protein [Oscillospiraceae bacterium]
MAGWDPIRKLVAEEIAQSAGEGCDVTGFAGRLAAAQTDVEVMGVYEGLKKLRPMEGYPYVEPDDLDAIMAEAPKGRAGVLARIKEAFAGKGEDEVRERIRGAWVSRCVGCALGKPLETKGFMYTLDGSMGCDNAYKWFKGADAYPVAGYVPAESRAEALYGLRVNDVGSLRGRIECMEQDDDVMYTVYGLLMMERHNGSFDRWDVGRMWHRLLPYGNVCVSETQAYLNFANVTSHTEERPADFGDRAEYVRRHLNPMREGVGARIRADSYAYAAAGDPELAATLAYRDATFSCTRNGVYAAMMAAAMISAAFATDDPREAVEAGLAFVPERSRLCEAVRLAVSYAEEADGQMGLLRKVWAAFNRYPCVHAVNNTALCAAALVYGRGDYDLTLSTAVLGGWDTDCNGATVGSVLGAMLSEGGVPVKWKAPLNDTLYAGLIGFHPISIRECADRGFGTWRRLRSGRAS